MSESGESLGEPIRGENDGEWEEKTKSNDFDDIRDTISGENIGAVCESNLDFVDNYDHIDPTVYYTTENIPASGIDSDIFHSQVISRCQCSKLVDAFTDANARMEALSNLCNTNCTCNPFCTYVDNKLNVDSYKLPIYECNNLCACRKKLEATSPKEDGRDINEINCGNRLIQYGPNKHLVIFKHNSSKGYGVKCTRHVDKGEFICEYAGEMVDRNEAKRRYMMYKDNGFECNYIFHLNEISGKMTGHELDSDIVGEINHDVTDNVEIMLTDESMEKQNISVVEETDHHVETIKAVTEIANNSVLESIAQTKFPLVTNNDGNGTQNQSEASTPRSESDIHNLKPNRFEIFIDATNFGNIGRYINHSCEPNCIVVPIRVNCVYPSLAIFANEDIPLGDEITYGYGFDAINDEFDKLNATLVCSGNIFASGNTSDNLTRCLCGKAKCRKHLPCLPLH